ncbi:hypothetical protein [Leucobacter triazinivorans]|uniref:Uncharacterized protein n=1 Tax=Leucobacter triazinivorans TaxID=1784719 RepID=A0A4P6KH05_9MICO|nr:hypothetical protein [Leucobacter triazinivorans]QBE48804.1 hypothetical protein EVS81_08140 [Leucobacter triazinivorans]
MAHHEQHEHHAPNGRSEQTGATESDEASGVSSSGAGDEKMDRPILDGSTDDLGHDGQRQNPRYGMSDPGLIRHPETGEKTPIPDEEA